ncbi:MAG: glycosyltransferase [Clostridia bacterium]|nr:glycosyltransferase [Clostridia bacterium]
MMDNFPKISVIVPCYKVERWLPACVESLRKQSYPNLELIFVDDGSPDACGSILDAYAEKDARIRVVHQQNRGLSGARNAGLDLASGEFVAFLDSDDTADPEMISALFGGLSAADADISVCGFRLVFEDSAPAVAMPLEGVDAPTAYSRREALCRLIAGKPYPEFAWNKLFRRSLWDGIRFPEGRNFEDIAVMYRVFCRASRVVAIPGTYIAYLQRKSSIIGTRSFKNEMDAIAAHTERFRALAPSDKALSDLLLKNFVRRPLRHLALISLWNPPAALRAEADGRAALKSFLTAQRSGIRPLCGAADRAIVSLLSRGTIPAYYAAGAIAFCLRLAEKAGLKKEIFITDAELSEAVHAN